MSYQKKNPPLLNGGFSIMFYLIGVIINIVFTIIIYYINKNKKK